ncbi:hypothetical protein D3C72_1444990 [compost metagenome]
MERRGYGQQQCALGACRLGQFAGALDGGLVSRDHDLRGRIEVHCFDDFALRGGSARGAHGIVIQTENRGHGARANRHGSLHGVGAHAYQAHGIVKRQRTGGRQRGVLAQAVAGHDVGLATARGAPGRVERDAGRQHGGLGIGGQVELLHGPLRDQRAQVLPEGLRGLRHGVSDRRNARPGIQHADSLRTLARKDKSDFHD